MQVSRSRGHTPATSTLCTLSVLARPRHPGGTVRRSGGPHHGIKRVGGAPALGPKDPSNNFPSYYRDGNGVALQICQDGPPNCLAGPELMQDVHAAGGDAEGFYWAADATTAHFALHDALEAAYAADGPNQEVTFQRTQVTARAGGLTGNTAYTVTDPYGTFTCTTAAPIVQNACRWRRPRSRRSSTERSAAEWAPS